MFTCGVPLSVSCLPRNRHGGSQVIVANRSGTDRQGKTRPIGATRALFKAPAGSAEARAVAAAYRNTWLAKDRMSRAISRCPQASTFFSAASSAAGVISFTGRSPRVGSSSDRSQRAFPTATGARPSAPTWQYALPRRFRTCSPRSASPQADQIASSRTDQCHWRSACGHPQHAHVPPSTPRLDSGRGKASFPCRRSGTLSAIACRPTAGPEGTALARQKA